jgi:hypothetical protein
MASSPKTAMAAVAGKSFDFSPAAIAASPGGVSSPKFGAASPVTVPSASSALSPTAAAAAASSKNRGSLSSGRDDAWQERAAPSHFSYSVASSTLPVALLQPPRQASKQLVRCQKRSSEPRIAPESNAGIKMRRLVS